MTQALVKVSESARKGEIIVVKVLIRHRMESGHRRDRVGAPIPRNIVHSFSAHYAGAEVFRMELFPGIAANSFLEFKTVARESGEMVLRWADDAGERYQQSVMIEVS